MARRKKTQLVDDNGVYLSEGRSYDSCCYLGEAVLGSTLVPVDSSFLGLPKSKAHIYQDSNRAVGYSGALVGDNAYAKRHERGMCNPSARVPKTSLHHQPMHHQNNEKTSSTGMCQ